MTTRPVRPRLAALVLLPALVLLAGCTDDDAKVPPTTTSTTPATATTTTPGAPSTTATTAGPGPTAASATTTLPAPAQVTGLSVTTGAGSGEVDITWPPLPSPDVASYRLTKRKADGTVLPPATVTSATLGAILPGRLGLTDAPDFGPWPSMEFDPGPRCYTVSAVSTAGVEGPPSAEACGSPVGG